MAPKPIDLLEIKQLKASFRELHDKLGELRRHL